MSDHDRTLTFTGHLEELRTRLIICAVAWVVLTGVAFPAAKYAIGLLTRPLESATRPHGAPRLVIDLTSRPSSPKEEYGLVARLENVTTDTKHIDKMEVDIRFPGGQIRSIGEGASTGSNFYYANLMDPIWLIFQTALILGIILSIPVWVWQIWGFISPGLTDTERRAVVPLFWMSTVLFPIGVVFAYFMLRMMIGFLLSIHIERVAPLLDYARYASFAIKVLAGFGLIFELPVAILLLAHLGVVTPQLLRKYRPYAVIAMAIAAMLITPTTDPISMVVMLIPLMGLYELSVWLSYLAARNVKSRWETE